MHEFFVSPGYVSPGYVSPNYVAPIYGFLITVQPVARPGLQAPDRSYSSRPSETSRSAET